MQQLVKLLAESVTAAEIVKIIAGVARGCASERFTITVRGINKRLAKRRPKYAVNHRTTSLILKKLEDMSLIELSDIGTEGRKRYYVNKAYFLSSVDALVGASG